MFAVSRAPAKWTLGQTATPITSRPPVGPAGPLGSWGPDAVFATMQGGRDARLSPDGSRPGAPLPYLLTPATSSFHEAVSCEEILVLSKVKGNGLRLRRAAGSPDEHWPA